VCARVLVWVHVSVLWRCAVHRWVVHASMARPTRNTNTRDAAQRARAHLGVCLDLHARARHKLGHGHLGRGRAHCSRVGGPLGLRDAVHLRLEDGTRLRGACVQWCASTRGARWTTA
jgi:hypothetical protein